MRYCAYGFTVLVLASVACAKANPASPSGSVATPQPLAPASGALIANSAQPVTLVVQNATATSSGTTYTFEVATDAAFSNKVQTKIGVAEGAGGQTSATLSTLPASTAYYWHAQALSGNTTGLFSAAVTFTIGAPVTLNAPTLVSPANGSTTATQPVLTIVNSTRTGPAGVISYRFDISTSASFTTIATSGSAPEGPGQTSFTLPTALATNMTFYWRAVAIDQTNLVSSPASTTNSFRTVSFPGVAAGIANQLGQVLWPGAIPAGTNGQAILGTNCDGTPNWGPTTCYSPTSGVTFASPTLEMLRVFDLLDRGYDPQSAINWMNGNGYPTSAAWYPYPKVVIGFQYLYISSRDQGLGPGTIWDVQVSLG